MYQLLSPPLPVRPSRRHHPDVGGLQIPPFQKEDLDAVRLSFQVCEGSDAQCECACPAPHSGRLQLLLDAQRAITSHW